MAASFDPAEGWTQAWVAKDGTIGYSRVDANGQSEHLDVHPDGSRAYVAPDGTQSGIGPDGRPYNPSPASATPVGSAAGAAITDTVTDPLGAVRKGTDKLGITTPDPSGDPAYQQLVEAANAFKGAYGSAGGGVSESRALDMGTVSQLQDAASGKTPGAGESLLRTAADQNARQSLGLAATLQGTNPGMALRSGLSAFQDAGARSAADIATIRAKEQEAARALLANQTAGLAQRDVAREGSQGGLYAQAVGAPYGAKERAGASNQALYGSVIGAAVKASDERVKTNIADGSGMADEFLESLSAPKTYEYKDPGPLRPPGPQLGPMAQDLPKRDVVTGPDGTKYIDASVMSDMMAGLGRLHERLGAVEGKKPQGGTAAGSPREYEAAMNYMTAPKVDAGNYARVAAGRPPGPRTSDPSPGGVQVPPAVLRQFLASMGLVTQ